MAWWLESGWYTSASGRWCDSRDSISTLRMECGCTPTRSRPRGPAACDSPFAPPLSRAGQGSSSACRPVPGMLRAFSARTSGSRWWSRSLACPSASGLLLRAASGTSRHMGSTSVVCSTCSATPTRCSTVVSQTAAWIFRSAPTRSVSTSTWARAARAWERWRITLPTNRSSAIRRTWPCDSMATGGRLRARSRSPRSTRRWAVRPFQVRSRCAISTPIRSSISHSACSGWTSRNCWAHRGSRCPKAWK